MQQVIKNQQQIYTTLLKKAQSTFTILAFYQDEFSDTHYDIDTDKFIIDDSEAFNQKMKEYFNSTTKTIEEKLYLAKVMQMQGSGVNFDVDRVTDSIDNEIIKTFVKDMFMQRIVTIGTAEDDVLQTSNDKNRRCMTLDVTQIRYNNVVYKNKQINIVNNLYSNRTKKAA